MKILRFDSVGGASGDMILSSFMAIGVSPSELSRKLSLLPLKNFKLQVKFVSDHGFHGKQLSVTIKSHDKHHHHHRNLADIVSLIKKSKLSNGVKNLSISIFKRLAEAEAKVHGTTPAKIHFHEVGAIDSIVDIVGSCIALEMLDVDSVTVGPLPSGCGTISCAHGILPNPAPATLELLKGHPVIQTDEPFELVTPTGAAILTAWKSCQAEVRGQISEVRNSGNGFGHWKLISRPNLLRATIYKTVESHRLPSDLCPLTSDLCLVIECNIDDTIPELIGSLAQKLMKKGALDVFTTPIQMKKQRPGILLTVLCIPADSEKLIDLIFSESTTFGIREYLTNRTVLDRRHKEVKTPYGKVRIKIGTWKGKDITRSPEHDDCVKCAIKFGVPVRTVYESALRGR